MLEQIAGTPAGLAGSHAPALDDHHGHTDSLVWIAAIAGLLTAVATTALVVIAWRALASVQAARDGLRDARDTRHAQLLADFSARFDSRTMKRSDALAREFGPDGLAALSDRIYGPHKLDPTDPLQVDRWRENLKDWQRCIEWPNLLETIGVMIDAQVLPEALIRRMWRTTILAAWDLWKKPTEAHRGHLNDQEIFRNFQRLAEGMETD